MAAELGQSKRQIDRGFQFLETKGWISRKRGGPDDKVNITLLIPAADAELHHFGAKKIDAIRANKVAHINGSHTRQNRASYAPEKGVIRAIQCGASKEQVEQIEQGAASPRASGLVDREEQAFRELIELRPLSDPSQEPAARAAYGALLKTTRIDDIIDEACSFEKRPEDCVSFLAYLASNKPGVSLGSS
jgi:hypothetical protein